MNIGKYYLPIIGVSRMSFKYFLIIIGALALTNQQTGNQTYFIYALGAVACIWWFAMDYYFYEVSASIATCRKSRAIESNIIGDGVDDMIMLMSQVVDACALYDEQSTDTILLRLKNQVNKNKEVVKERYDVRI